MISVVIPCYNAAATLRETIDSVLAQDTQCEMIVVDDGSSDASAEILQSYGERLRWLSTPNRGASAARTLGTEMARGRFIQYLDSDDLLVPGTLAARRAALEASGADVAHTDWQKLEQEADTSFRLADLMRPDTAAIERDAETAAATGTFWAPPAALLYRRDIVERIGSWSPSLPVIQDARFLFDAAALGARFQYVPGVGALYRVTAGSLSRRSTARFIADCARNAEEIEALWRRQEPLSNARRKALAGMWTHVATSALINGLDQFERARDGYNRIASRRVTFEIAFMLRAALGPPRSAAVVNVVRGKCSRALGRT